MQAPERKRGLPAWLVPLALAIVAILAVLLLLSRCGGSDSSGSAAQTSSTPTTASATTSAPSPSPSTSTGAGGDSGTVTAGGKTMLPLTGEADASLSSYAGQDVAATSVKVQSVPADEGFWVGDSKTNRIWVQLTGKAGESPYKVKTGDMVTFTGTVAKNPAGFADKIGVTGPEGKSQLTEQNYHITAAKSALRLAK